MSKKKKRFSKKINKRKSCKRKLLNKKTLLNNKTLLNKNSKKALYKKRRALRESLAKEEKANRVIFGDILDKLSGVKID